MALETASYIVDLNPFNPLPTDQKREGDDHLRLIKSVLQATFPRGDGPINYTSAQINDAINRTKDFVGAGHNGTWASSGVNNWHGKDLNNITDAGWYWYDSTTGNRPSNQGFLLAISTMGNNATPTPGPAIAQIAFEDVGSSNINVGFTLRFNYGSGWSSWTYQDLASYYVSRGGSTMWGELDSNTGNGAYSFRVTGNKAQAFADWNANSTPALQIDCPNGDSAYMLWRATRWGGAHLAAAHVYENGYGGQPDISFAIGSASRKFIFSNDGNFYTSKFGWLSDYLAQFAHANSNFAWDLVWTGSNGTNINLPNNWGHGIFLVRSNAGEIVGIISSGTGHYAETSTGSLCAVGDTFWAIGTSGYGANAIWKFRKT